MKDIIIKCKTKEESHFRHEALLFALDCEQRGLEKSVLKKYGSFSKSNVVMYTYKVETTPTSIIVKITKHEH